MPINKFEFDRIFDNGVGRAHAGDGKYDHREIAEAGTYAFFVEKLAELSPEDRREVLKGLGKYARGRFLAEKYPDLAPFLDNGKVDAASVQRPFWHDAYAGDGIITGGELAFAAALERDMGGRSIGVSLRKVDPDDLRFGFKWTNAAKAALRRFGVLPEPDAE